MAIDMSENSKMMEKKREKAFRRSLSLLTNRIIEILLLNYEIIGQGHEMTLKIVKIYAVFINISQVLCNIFNLFKFHFVCFKLNFCVRSR